MDLRDPVQPISGTSKREAYLLKSAEAWDAEMRASKECAADEEARADRRFVGWLRRHPDSQELPPPADSGEEVSS
jgi:hypothetical protein